VEDDPADLLVQALAEPVATPVERDWSFRRNDHEGGFNRYGWNDYDQQLLEACWDDEATELAEGLISNYGAMWPWPMPRAVAARHPRLSQAVLDLAIRRLIGQRHTYADHPDAVSELALMYGSFDRLRRDHDWPDPVTLECRVCAARFSEAVISPWMIRQYGPPRYCASCCVRARNGLGYEDDGALLRAIRILAAAIDGIPSQNIHQTISIAGLDPERRDRAMVGLIVGPHPALPLLQRAGIVGEAWRPARGTYCFAADGHPCRSLAERVVDDWLASRSIAHTLEPTYPGSNKRADWLLADGTFIEYAGMMGDADYRARMEEKRRLAGAAGVRLVILLPEDLVDLSRVLGPLVSA